MENWFLDHIDHPFLTPRDKSDLIKESGLSSN